MTKSNKIGILRADHDVGLSQAFIEINIGFEILFQVAAPYPMLTLPL